MTAVLSLLALVSTLGQVNPQPHPRGGYRIAGVVVDAVTGAPVPQAQVSIVVRSEEMSVVASDQGRFALEGIEAGKYAISAAAPGYVREAYNQHGPYSTAITTGDGQDSEHLVFRLHPQALIYGRVTDERGEAVRGAQVQLFALERSRGIRAKFVRAQTQTNDLGEYRFPHLLPGNYYLVIQARPWYAETQVFVRRQFDRQTVQDDGSSEAIVATGDGRSFSISEPIADVDSLLDVVYPITFYPGVTDERSSTELVLGAGEKQEANITLQALPADGGSSTSINVGASQKVFGTPSFGFGINSGQIAPGEYEIAGLPPGDITVVVTTNKGNESRSQTIDVDSRAGRTLDASGLQATAKVSGRVFDPEGGPETNGGFVSLISSATPTQPVAATAQLEKDGTFSFPEVQAGGYRIDVNLRSGGYYVQKVSAKEAKASGREITIAGGNDMEVTVTMGRGLGQVSGVVQFDGKPVAGVMVLLVPESGQEMEEDSRMDQSDSDGTFNLGGIHPGKYVLLAIKDGWELEWAKPGVLKPYLEAGQRVSISPNQSMKVTVAAQERTAATEKKPQ